MSKLVMSALLFITLLLAVFTEAASARSLHQAISGCSGSLVNKAIGKIGEQAGSLVEDGLGANWPAVSRQLSSKLGALNYTQGDWDLYPGMGS